MDGLERASPLMLRRTLLELAAVRRVVRGEHSLPLRQLLADATLLEEGREASLVLRATAMNNVVYVDHQEMYNTIYLCRYLDLEVIIECNPHRVEKWVYRAGGGPDNYTFDGVQQDTRDAMVKELDSLIDRLKERLASSGFDKERGCYVSRE